MLVTSRDLQMVVGFIKEDEVLVDGKVSSQFGWIEISKKLKLAKKKRNEVGRKGSCNEGRGLNRDILA